MHVNYINSGNTMKMKKGFTLIELLVVIAIIGLLTSVALASLKIARDKAADATIKQNLAQIRAQAQIVYDNSGNAESYVGTFGANNVGQKIFDAAFVAAGCVDPDPDCGDNFEAAGNPLIAPSSWMAWVSLKTNPDNAWCVDYLGISRKIMTPSNAFAVPPYTCPAGI